MHFFAFEHEKHRWWPVYSLVAFIYRGGVPNVFVLFKTICTTYIWRTYIPHVTVNKHSTTQLNIFFFFFFEIHNPRVVQCRDMDNTYKGLIVPSAVARDKTPVSVTTLLTNANDFLIWKLWHANQVGVKKQQLWLLIFFYMYLWMNQIWTCNSVSCK